MLVLALPAGATTRFTLTGHGWGHGIGLSQWGAYGYAQHGFTYRQILQHFYTGVTIGDIGGSKRYRVLLGSSRASVHFGSADAMGVVAEGDGSERTIPAGDYRIEAGATPGMQRIWNATAGRWVAKGLDGPVRIDPTGAPLQLNDATNFGVAGNHWFGSFRTFRAGSSLALVSDVGLENYVRSVVPCEVSASWPVAAVRAQAVAARSYAWATRRLATAQFDAYGDTRSQSYCPLERQAGGSDDAVAATAGEVIMSGGAVATAFYSSSSGGRTSTPAASWGSTATLPYLQPVTDRYDRAGGSNTNHDWSRVVYGPLGLGRAFGLGRKVTAVDHRIDVGSFRVTRVTLHLGNGSTVQRDPRQPGFGPSLRSTYFRILGLSLNAPSTVRSGAGFTVSGRMWPKPSGPVRLQSRVGSGAWQTVSMLSLGPLGRFSVHRVRHRSGAFRLVRVNAVSPVVPITVTTGGSRPMHR